MERGNWVYIEEGMQKDPDMYSMPDKYRQYIQGIFITQGEIQDRIKRLAEKIMENYGNQTFNILVVLRGAFRFAKDLVDSIDALGRNNMKNYDIQFIRCKSYTNTEQSQEIQISGLEIQELGDRPVLIVEDLIDTGRSMKALIDKLNSEGIQDVKLCCLAYKRKANHQVIVEADFLGFSLPDDWIVGYHIDYNDYFRDFPHVAYINDSAKVDFKV